MMLLNHTIAGDGRIRLLMASCVFCGKSCLERRNEPARTQVPGVSQTNVRMMQKKLVPTRAERAPPARSGTYVNYISGTANK
jgi:hypothetical protein